MDIPPFTVQVQQCDYGHGIQLKIPTLQDSALFWLDVQPVLARWLGESTDKMPLVRYDVASWLAAAVSRRHLRRDHRGRWRYWPA